MLIPNNSDIDFTELNRRIEAEVQRYKRDNGERQLPAFDPSPAAVVNRHYEWQELSTLDDEPLIRAAYQTLLGREASHAEVQQRLDQLRAGHDKFEFLAELRDSPEGVAKGVKVHGLRKARLKNRLRRIPVIGRLALLAIAVLQSEPRHRHYLARLNQIDRQQRLQREMLELQQQQLQELQHTLATDLGRLQDAQRRAANEQRHVQQELRARMSELERQPRAMAAIARPAQPAELGGHSNQIGRAHV